MTKTPNDSKYIAPAGKDFAHHAAPARSEHTHVINNMQRHQIAALHIMVGEGTPEDHKIQAAWVKNNPSAQGTAFNNRYNIGAPQRPNPAHNHGRSP